MNFTFHKVKLPNWKDEDATWVLQLEPLSKMGIQNVVLYYAFTYFTRTAINNPISSTFWHNNDTGFFMQFMVDWYTSFTVEATVKGVMKENCSFLPRDSYEILETKEVVVDWDKDQLNHAWELVLGKLGEKKYHSPRFIKWRTGTHWYVKYGDRDVVVDGVQKWDTKQEAQKAFAIWLNRQGL